MSEAQDLRKLAADLRTQADVAERIAIELDMASKRLQKIDLVPPVRVKHLALSRTSWGEIRKPCTCELGVNHNARAPKGLE